MTGALNWKLVVKSSLEEVFDAWKAWTDHAAEDFTTPYEDWVSCTFLNIQLLINNVGPMIIKFVRSIYFNPRDLQGRKKNKCIDEVESSFCLGTI